MSENTFHVLSSRLPDFIIASGEREKISHQVDNLPNFAKTPLHFETVLNTTNKTDFSFVLIDDFIESFLNHKENLTTFINDSHYKERVLEFLKYSQANKNKNIFYESIWFECDLNHNVLPKSDPSIFYKLTNQKQDYESILHAMEIAMGKEMSRKWVENFYRCADLSTNDSFPQYIGYMPHRNENALRIGITGLSYDQLFFICEKFGILDKNFEENRELIFELNALAGSFLVLNIDIGEKIYSKKGIEFRFSDISFKHRDQKKRILSVLKRNNYCSIDMCDFFSKWEGITREQLHKELYKYNIHKYIFYFKINFIDNQKEVKIYYGFNNLEIE